METQRTNVHSYAFILDYINAAAREAYPKSKPETVALILFEYEDKYKQIGIADLFVMIKHLREIKKDDKQWRLDLRHDMGAVENDSKLPKSSGFYKSRDSLKVNVEIDFETI